MMDFKEIAKRKHETYSKSTETSDLLTGSDGALVFYTKDASGYIRMHTYKESGRTIELVDSFPEVVVPPKKESVVEEKAGVGKKDGIVAKAVRKLKGK